MLTAIQIKNFALIEQLSLDLSAGMTVITGETGAGKSIVIDALSLALGERADSGVVRFGANKADISACFSIEQQSDVKQWLKENELDDEDDCILRRVIAKEGRSRCFINGQPVTLSALKSLGELLIDIHGQHAHQSLIKPTYQMKLLDELLPSKAPLESVKQVAKEHRAAVKQLEKLKLDESQRVERSELLAYQLEELEALQLSVESIESLESEHQRANNIQDLTAVTQATLSDLFDNDPSIYESLNRYQEQIHQLAKKDPKLNNVFECFVSATSSLEEIRTELSHYQDSLDIDPQQIQELDEQMSTLFDLSRKHKVDILELPQVEANIREELTELQSQQSNYESLQERIDALASDYLKHAEALSASRTKAAKKLEKEVTQQMQQLGMEGGKFQIQLPKNSETYSRNGLETVDFQVSANPGQPLHPLGKVASGGELSRISLAIQVITAQKKVIPTLIFDEVDVGIGGQTADVVGRMLRRIAEHAQILCVTHQPQVAARGQHHLSAVKNRKKDSTETAMTRLADQHRIEEIARMVGGQDITESTLNHAKELLAS